MDGKIIFSQIVKGCVGTFPIIAAKNEYYDRLDYIFNSYPQFLRRFGTAFFGKW